MNKIGTAMIIDDEEIDQKTYERILKKTGLVDRILMFTYAEDALAYLKSHKDDPIDVIYLDINMPRMTGFEFLEAATQELGEEFTQLVVVMLTTSILQSDRERAEAHPLVRAFFEKPLTPQQVEETGKLLAEVKATAA